MLKKTFLLLTLIFFSNLHAFIVGNPSSPGFFTKGLISKNQVFYLRSGYFYDEIYKGEYKEKFQEKDPLHNILKLRSQGAMITFNVKNRWDLYTLIGTSKMNFDDEVFTKNHLSWGVGTKLLVYKLKNCDLTIDGKYFRTNQDSNYFILDDQVYPILTENFGFRIEQYQASVGLSYKFKILAPYIGATYLYSTIEPYPTTRGLIRFPSPDEDIISDFKAQNAENLNQWGFVAGISIISNNTVNINAESRLFDQNAFNVTTEIRF